MHEPEFSKVLDSLSKNLNEIVNHNQSRSILIQLLNNLDEAFEEKLFKYKEWLNDPDETLKKNIDKIEKTNSDFQIYLKVIMMLLDHQESFDLFSSLDRLIDLIILSTNLTLLRKTLDVIYKYLSNSRLKIEHISEFKDKIGRLVHYVSMIILHQNLYNPKELSFAELLADDSKFQELQAHSGGRVRPQMYHDRLEFEYFLAFANNPSMPTEHMPDKRNTVDENNITIKIKSINESYPHDSHIAICKKIIHKEGLQIEENSPIFDALLLRIRLSRHFESYEDRILIVKMVLSALRLLSCFRKNQNLFKK